MAPLTRSAAAAARSRRQTRPKPSGPGAPDNTRSTRSNRSTRVTRSTRVNRPSGSTGSRFTGLPVGTVPFPQFSRPRRLVLPHAEDRGRSSRLTSGLIDDPADPDPEDRAAGAPSHYPASGPSGGPSSRSTARLRRPTRQEVFTRLLPNYARDRRREQAAAAARRRLGPAVPQRRRRSLFGELGTRRWFRRSAVGQRVTAEAQREVSRAMERFELLVRRWLLEVSAPRRTPSMADVLTVLRLSGVAGTEAKLRRLVRRYLPLEQQMELIRVAESGGRLYPATDPLSGR